MAGRGQVHGARARVGQVVQQNATLEEGASAAAESMKDQAAGLLALVSRFKVGEGAAPGAAAALRPVQAMPRAGVRRPVPAQLAALMQALQRPASGQQGQWEEF